LIHFQNSNFQNLEATRNSFVGLLGRLFLDQCVRVQESRQQESGLIIFSLDANLADSWAPVFDTLQLCHALNLDTLHNTDDLYREILLAMLLGPVPFVFPDMAELQAVLRMRRNIVETARKTELSFSTEGIMRPAEYWQHDDERGFTLLPGKSLIRALRNTLLPEESGRRYGFSCYRATEYVVLLGIAQELHEHNSSLYRELEQLWERRALMSTEFQETLLKEYGSLHEPLPSKYYVPGDRVWFRNPDEYSSNATGYEGSWVFYLGNGRFNNFWKNGSEYTLSQKCVEIFHWRNAVYTDSAGELQIDEDRVDALVGRTLADPAEKAAILDKMMRLREPQGVYVAGGCIDATREHPRRVCPATSDICFPETESAIFV
jgi:hypothetical protein